MSPALATLILTCLVVLTALGLGYGITQADGLRYAVALSATSLLVVTALRWPAAAVSLLVVWLVALGTTRRIVSLLSAPAQYDVLLLVGPAVITTLALVAISHGGFREMSVLAKAVAILDGLLLVEVLNPLQGGYLVGLAGLLFLFIPSIAFWIGRELLGDRDMKRAMAVMGVVAIPAALYGLSQTFIGFPVWDTEWIRTSAFTSLTIAGATRGFASFSSPAEYSAYVALGALLAFTIFRSRRALPMALVLGVVATAAVAYSGTRGAVVNLLIAVTVTECARRRIPVLLAGGLGLVAILVVLPFAASHMPSDGSTATGSAVLLQHQVDGLANPLDPNTSTASGHLGLIASGLNAVTKAPLGAGTGSVTLAGSQFGQAGASTEADVSNAAVAVGLPGLAAFVCIVGVGVWRAYNVARRRRDAVSLAALGVMLVVIASWLNGGLWSVAWLPWLCLGWVDRAARRLPDEDVPETVAAVTVRPQPLGSIA